MPRNEAVNPMAKVPFFYHPLNEIIGEITLAIHKLCSSTCYAVICDNIKDIHVLWYSEIR